MPDLVHSIRVVVRRTGLSPHLIRVWERRYQAVVPARTETNRRLYSEEEVERLTLLCRVTRLGHGIAQVARLSTARLRQLMETQADAGAGVIGAGSVETAANYLEDCLAAIRRLDSPGLEAHLRAASLQLGAQGVLLKLVAPLAQQMGALWQAGEMTAAHEHFASAVIRVFVAGLSRPFALDEHAPLVIVATPVGQLHELGAVLVAGAAAGHGWRVAYLGVNLPAAEIAGAAVRSRARAVALSLQNPEDDPRLAAELESLRRYLPAEIAILVGGRAAAAYRETLRKVGAWNAASLAEVYTMLDRIRSAPTQPVEV